MIKNINKKYFNVKFKRTWINLTEQRLIPGESISDLLCPLVSFFINVTSPFKSSHTVGFTNVILFCLKQVKVQRKANNASLFFLFMIYVSKFIVLILNVYCIKSIFIAQLAFANHRSIFSQACRFIWRTYYLQYVSSNLASS